MKRFKVGLGLILPRGYLVPSRFFLNYDYDDFSLINKSDRINQRFNILSHKSNSWCEILPLFLQYNVLEVTHRRLCSHFVCPNKNEK
jgi:hypothetical protein